MGSKMAPFSTSWRGLLLSTGVNAAPRHHLDYDLDKKQQAGRYYQKAVELEPNNPIFVPLCLCFILSFEASNCL